MLRVSESSNMSIDEVINEVMQEISSRQDWREEISHGKMFGVLIYRDREGREGYLKAYSGQILGRSDWDDFVPAIYDCLQPDGYFKQEESNIVMLHREGQPTRERSAALQRWLFERFVLTNPEGQQRSVLDVFQDYARANHSKQVLPPGGTGECCAPKLLNYANQHSLEVVDFAEFWYGDSPNGEVRHHGRLYEPCQAKCMPILWFLLKVRGERLEVGGEGVDVDESLVTLYEDEWLLAVDKPAGMLSVPGKIKRVSAEELLKEKGIFRAIHRLDMDTSGIILFAKDEGVYKAMQRMFALHENVRKEYVAILEGEGIKGNGTISLPLASDFLNRPMQRVDYENGKEAVTEYAWQGRLIHLYPLTGRTHQLRMHCAHKDGLGMPILGDPLYGNEHADRMYLHAHRLEFIHPVTRQKVEIVSPVPF